jgi:hypothetical protein
VKSPLAVLILFSILAFLQGQAATVSGLNTKPERCPAMASLMVDLNAAQFPADWTVYVACDPGDVAEHRAAPGWCEYGRCDHRP